jgi:tetratricopeptide (TPR) repeat protein
LQIARVLIDCKSPEAALPLLAEARDTLVQVDAPPSLVAKVHVNEGWALSKLKRFDEAIAAHTEARDLAVREHGGDHPDVAYATGQIGSDHLNADRPDTALPFLEDALAMYDRLGTKGDDRGFVELMAARVLAARDPVRARSLATRALGRFADMPGRDEQRAALTALLEELPR